MKFLTLVSILMATVTSSFAQGSFTPPPGPPGPVMKSLSQMEPRTAITNTASKVIITQPGSYYLMGNLTVSTGNGIEIETNNVTLDLNGFTIASTSPTNNGWGIKIDTFYSILRNIVVRNGHIVGGVTNNGSGSFAGGGFAFGITYSGSPAHNVLVSQVMVSGTLLDGIAPGEGVVENCSVRTSSTGINASVVRQCEVTDCYTGIAATTVSDCTADCTGGNAIYATTAQNCNGKSATGTGISAATALNCYGESASGSYGMNVAGTASFCRGYRPGGNAIAAGIAIGCTAISGNIVSSSKFLGTP